MPILIFKTDLKTSEDVRNIRPILDLHPAIIDWNVDTEDVDNVLRMKSQQNVTERDVITLLKQYNIYSETLNY